tara:strand:+ start:232 stop:1359 length:1128 start_codon:yes stop_codon:yes gene_type:complete
MLWSNLLLFVFYGSITSYAAVSTIGNITESSGSNGVKRDGGIEISGSQDLDILFKDTLETAQGRMKVMFLDETNLSLTEHSEVTIDEYIFDPNPTKSKLAMSFVQGTARFATGRLGLVPKENIVINTPTATIGVRGTDFTTTVDELGRSLVILLPETECTIDGDCSPSGEITVTNDGGQVVLSEAYAATMVSSFDNAPMTPVVLENITILQIDNMFIVSPPPQIEEQMTEDAQSADATDAILDFNELDIDQLAEDWDDEEADLEFSELDINFLDGDFLQNVLTAFISQDFLEESSSSNEIDVQGTSFGYDAKTGYNTIIDSAGGELRFYRFVNGVISIRTSMTTNITLDSENEGKKNFITNGDGQSVLVTIRQGG